jgi:hypothetical protein
MPTGRRPGDGWFERFFKIRRDAREAEGAPLLREYRVKSLIEGSTNSSGTNSDGRRAGPSAARASIMDDASISRTIHRLP